MRVAALCGSLQSGSTNPVVLAAIANRLKLAGATVEPVAVVSAATAGGANAIEQLSLTTVGDNLTDDAALSHIHRIALPIGIDPSDRRS